MMHFSNFHFLFSSDADFLKTSFSLNSLGHYFLLTVHIFDMISSMHFLVGWIEQRRAVLHFESSKIESFCQDFEVSPSGYDLHEVHCCQAAIYFLAAFLTKLFSRLPIKGTNPRCKNSCFHSSCFVATVLLHWLAPIHRF